MNRMNDRPRVRFMLGSGQRKERKTDTIVLTLAEKSHNPESRYVHVTESDVPPFAVPTRM
jgi:hypothetical protein